MNHHCLSEQNINGDTYQHFYQIVNLIHPFCHLSQHLTLANNSAADCSVKDKKRLPLVKRLKKGGFGKCSLKGASRSLRSCVFGASRNYNSRHFLL